MKTSAFSKLGNGHAEPLSQKEEAFVFGRIIELSARPFTGRLGMKAPGLNWMPKNSAFWGIGEVVARVSGPRTVMDDAPSCLVTTISQRVTATEVNDSTGSLRVRQILSTKGESERRSSKAKSFAARMGVSRADESELDGT
jgi:hypothetical protein